MPNISTDMLLEYFIWMIIFSMFPVFLSSACATTIMNSRRARNIFENGISLVNKKVNDVILNLEGVQAFKDDASRRFD